MNKVHYNIQVIGKVQGVWFRKYTKDKAEKLGLNGIVRNNMNGDVYIEVEGKNDVVNNFIAWLYKGSPKSKVIEVVLEESKFVGYQNFKVIN